MRLKHRKNTIRVYLDINQNKHNSMQSYFQNGSVEIYPKPSPSPNAWGGETFIFNFLPHSVTIIHIFIKLNPKPPTYFPYFTDKKKILNA